MKPIPLLCLVIAASACARADHMGKPPSLTSPRNSEEFIAMTNPPLEIPVDSGRPEAAASLWAGTTSSLISDRRAATRGDILTVVIEIDNRAEIPLHPLDLSTYASTAGSYCMSMIQSTQSVASSSVSLPPENPCLLILFFIWFGVSDM